MKRAKTLIASGTAIVGLIFFGLQHRTIDSVDADPTGQYRAVVSYKSYLSLLPMPPGSSSDKPCFVEILGSDGTSQGEIPIPMCQMANVQWSTNGASVPMIGEWDFERRTCFYWSHDGNTRIYVKIGALDKEPVD